MPDEEFMQLDLEGKQITGTFLNIEFNCPFCDKLISLKQDEKSVWHRPWMFHFMYDHKPLVAFTMVHYKDELSLILFHFAVYDDEEWLTKIAEIKKAFAKSKKK